MYILIISRKSQQQIPAKVRSTVWAKVQTLPLLHLDLQATNETRVKDNADGTLHIRKVKNEEEPSHGAG